MKEVEDVLEQNKQQQYKEYQYQTISNLYDSGIPAHIIASQLDIDEEDVQKVIKVIKSASNNNNSLTFSVPLLESNNNRVAQPRDYIVDTEMAIRNAQVRMWKGSKGRTRNYLVNGAD